MYVCIYGYMNHTFGFFCIITDAQICIELWSSKGDKRRYGTVKI